MSCLSISQAAAAAHDLSRGVLNIIEEILLQHPSPTSYGQLLSSAWCWCMPAELRAARG